MPKGSHLPVTVSESSDCLLSIKAAAPPHPHAGRQHKAGEFVGLSMRAPVMVSRLHSAGNGPSPSPSPPPLLCDGHADAAGDSDTVVILASLLCALICVAGLAFVARCTCRRRNSGGGGGSNINPTATEVQAPRGLKKAAIETLPTVSLQAAAASRSGGAGEERECAICLVVLAEGDELRLLPLCGHGFHAACIDTWLGAHASCPSCRAAVLTCRRCGAAAATGDATT